MTVWVEAEEIAEGLDGDDSAGDGVPFGNDILHEDLQRLPSTATQVVQETPIPVSSTGQAPRKHRPQDLWDAENEMPVGRLLEHVGAQPLSEFHHSLLVARGTEVSALAGEGQEVLMIAVSAFHAGKAVAQVAALQIPVDDVPEIGGYKMINARAETIAEKPGFKDAFKRRRCLIPAEGFYEWQKLGKIKQPLRFYLKSGQPFGFAGLYESWMSPERNLINTCTIITTPPNELTLPIHDRMPAIVPKDKVSYWMDPG